MIESRRSHSLSPVPDSSGAMTITDAQRFGQRARHRPHRRCRIGIDASTDTTAASGAPFRRTMPPTSRGKPLWRAASTAERRHTARKGGPPTSSVKTKTPRLVSGVLCRVDRKCKEQLGVARTTFWVVQPRSVRNAGERCVDIQTEIALGGFYQDMPIMGWS